jgi:hypothetical protein
MVVGGGTRAASLQVTREVDPRQDAGAERLGVALDTGELPGEEESTAVATAQAVARARPVS